MTIVRKVLLLGVALIATSSAVLAADAPAKPQKSSAADVSNADLQKLITQFNARRDSILANREALLNQLKNATAEQRKAILDKMEAQQKDLMDAQRALGRQLRDEMRKLRQITPPGSGRH